MGGSAGDGWLDVVWRRKSGRARLGSAAFVAATVAAVAVALIVRPGGSAAPPALSAAASCGYENRVAGNPFLAGGHAPGGVVAVAPRGAIRPIDNPGFETPAAAQSWLGPQAPVVVVRVGNDVRAYPSAILLWHEVVNDVVGGRPLLVTFCPLCNTAMVYERRFGRAAHTFEVSGELSLGAAVLLDRADGMRYAQPTGAPLGPFTRAGAAGLLGLESAGPATAHAGVLKPLRWYPSDLMRLEQAASANPDLVVLSRDTGYRRDYGASPYARTGKQGTTPSLFDGFVDTRLEPKTRLVGIVVNGTAQAWLYTALREAIVRNDTVGGAPVAIFFRRDTASIADSRSLAMAPMVGSAGVFGARVAGLDLHFSVGKDGVITDRETGSRWDMTGRAVLGPLAGTRLTPLRHLDTYWYVWAARYPDTRVWPPLPAGPCATGGPG